MATQLRGAPLPIDTKPKIKVKARKITDEEKKFSAWNALRQARSFKRLAGVREKRAKERAEAAK